MNQKQRITILDIARRTGLSKGTVDRVLHNRGEVSKKSYEKVMKVIQELGYEPDMNASLLASRRSITIAVLIPDPGKGTFWEISLRGIEEASEQARNFGATIVHVGYTQYDTESFRQACKRILDLKPDGVVIAPLYRHESYALTEELQEQGIPYCFIDTKLEEENYLAYFGMPSYKSGYLCGDLLTCGETIDSVLIVRIRRENEEQYDPNVHRRSGFIDYLLENSPTCQVHYLYIDPTRPDGTEPALNTFFAAHPEVRKIIMFNSRVHLIAPYLEKTGMKQLRVIGFDNLDANVEALRRGTVSFLISQHPDEQVHLAILTLAEFLALKKLPAKRDNFMHMDVLTRYNVEYY